MTTTANNDSKGEILAVLKRKYFGRECLDAFIRANYDSNYISFFGMEGAYQSYIMHIRDDNGIAVGYDDCLAIAAEIYKEGF